MDLGPLKIIYAYFNSIKVRLEQPGEAYDLVAVKHFNSIKVRLEPLVPGTDGGCI